MTSINLMFWHRSTILRDSTEQRDKILCWWFRVSLTYINNCPTRCNAKRSIDYSASSLYMFPVSTTPIIRSTRNCNYSVRYWSYICAAASLHVTKLSLPLPETVVTISCTPDDGCGWHPKHVEWTCRIINRLLCISSRWTVINIKECKFTVPIQVQIVLTGIMKLFKIINETACIPEF